MLKFSGCSCLISDADIRDVINTSMCIRVIEFPIEITEVSVTNSMDPKTHIYIFHVRLGKNNPINGLLLVKHIKLIWMFSDTETDMLEGYPSSASCVQESDDSRNSAIRIAYRISLRSSSVWEPRYPSLKIFYFV